MIEVRNARVTDIPIICELVMQVWPQTYLPIIGSEQVSYMLNIFYNPKELKKQMEEWGHLFLISYREQCPVGFASYSEVKQGIFKLHKIYLLPDEQGRGSGQFIISHIIADIKSRGAKELMLNVNRYNTSAISFYLKNRFEKIYDEDIDIGNGYFMNDHVLSRNI